MRATIGVIIPKPLKERLFAAADCARLNGLGEVRWYDGAQHMNVAEAGRFLAGCDIAVGSWNTPYPCQELLDACPTLRLWEHAGGSVKHMFGPHLRGKNLLIASCAPTIAESVAEYTLAAIIAGCRRMLVNAQANRKGGAPKPERALPVSQAVIGIIGASLVGRAVIRLLASFGPRILVYDPFLSPEEAARLGVEKTDHLAEMCSICDVVTVHAPAKEDTFKLVNEQVLSAMKDDAVFINTARGACVDEEALVAELQKGRFFAFIDVTDPEPAVDESPLRVLPNVVLTSHIAGGPFPTIGTQVVDDIARFLEGGRPLFVVSEADLRRVA